MYDRIDQNPTIVIRVNVLLTLIYTLSPKLQTEDLSQKLSKARTLLSSKRSEKLQNYEMVTKRHSKNRKNEKAGQRKNCEEY